MEITNANQKKQTNSTNQTFSRMLVNCGCILEDINAYKYQALLTKEPNRQEEYLQHVQVLRKIYSEYCKNN